MVWAETADNPILPVSEAVNNVARSRWWIFVLVGLELLRQVHFVIAEHWSRYYRFWQRRFAALDKVVDRINPWTRYRLARLTKWMLILAAFNVLVAWRNDETFLKQLADLPSTVIDFMFGSSQDMPMIFVLLFTDDRGRRDLILFWYMSRGGIEVYYPDDVKTRFADVWGQDAVLAEDPGEPDLPGEPRGDRGEGRVRPRRHPALRAAGHRQDPHGRGGRRRDRQAVRVRRAGRVHEHVLRRGRPEGPFAVQEAAQARAPLRRGDRLLRRGRLAGQPRGSSAGMREAPPAGVVSDVLQRHDLSLGRDALGAAV